MANAVIEANGGVVEKFSEPEEVDLGEEISKEKTTKDAPKAKKPAAKKPAVKKVVKAEEAEVLEWIRSCCGMHLLFRSWIL